MRERGGGRGHRERERIRMRERERDMKVFQTNFVSDSRRKVSISDILFLERGSSCLTT